MSEPQLRHGAGATALAGLIARLRSLAGFAVFVPLGPPLLLSLLFLLPSRRLRVRLSNAVSRVFSALLLHLWAVRVELDHEERLSPHDVVVTVRYGAFTDSVRTLGLPSPQINFS